MTFGVLEKMFTCDKEGQHEWTRHQRCVTKRMSQCKKWWATTWMIKIWCCGDASHRWKSDFQFRHNATLFRDLFHLIFRQERAEGGMACDNSGHIDVAHWLGKTLGASTLPQWAGSPMTSCSLYKAKKAVSTVWNSSWRQQNAKVGKLHLVNIYIVSYRIYLFLFY